MKEKQHDQGRDAADGSWRSVTTSLAVTADGLDADVVQRALDLGPAEGDPGGPLVHSGTGWWSYTLDSDHPDHPDHADGQIAVMASRVEPLLGGLRRLADRGYHAHIALSGVVLMGTRLALSPESTARLASLRLPVSFTTLNEDNEPTPDPFDWLE